MKSLAEHLGIDITQLFPAPAAEEPPFEESAKKFALRVLNSHEYRRSLINRIVLGELPAAVECLLYDHAFGKPVKRVELDDRRDLASVSAAELEARALHLAALARELRMQESPDKDSIH